MRLWAEIPFFGAIALGAHLALFTGWPGGAREGAGDGGAASLTLAGGVADIEAAVAGWDAAPVAVADIAAPDAPQAIIAPSPPGPDARPSPILPPETASPPVRESAARLDPEPPLPLPDAPVEPEPPVPPAVASAVPPKPRPERPEPLPEAAEAQAQARSQRTAAAGAGDAGTRGERGRAPESGLSDTARRSLVASWGAEIRARVEARKMPPEGIRAAGRPVVRITVARNGTLEDVRIVQSSRVAALDEAALRAVRGAGRLPAAPGQLDLARASFDLPIVFTR
jgi:periplasmic protein TonB